MPDEMAAWIGGAIAVLLAIGLVVVASIYFKLWLQAFVNRVKATS